MGPLEGKKECRSTLGVNPGEVSVRREQVTSVPLSEKKTLTVDLRGGESPQPRFSRGGRWSHGFPVHRAQGLRGAPTSTSVGVRDQRGPWEAPPGRIYLS